MQQDAGEKTKSKALLSQHLQETIIWYFYHKQHSVKQLRHTNNQYYDAMYNIKRKFTKGDRPS